MYPVRHSGGLNPASSGFLLNENNWIPAQPTAGMTAKE
jgi:hypothetical protein